MPSRVAGAPASPVADAEIVVADASPVRVFVDAGAQRALVDYLGARVRITVDVQRELDDAARSVPGLRLLLRDWPPTDPVELPVELMQKAADILNAGKKIAILAGQGALRATDELERLDAVFARLRNRAVAPVLGKQRPRPDVLEDRHFGKGLCDLERAANAQPCNAVGWQPLDRLAFKRDRTGGRCEVPRDEVEQRGLARPVCTDDAEELAGLHRERQIIDRLDPAKELAEPGNFKHCRHAPPRVPVDQTHPRRGHDACGVVRETIPAPSLSLAVPQPSPQA